MVSYPLIAGNTLQDEFAAHWVVAVNVILVVGHEKLNVEMQRTYGNRMTVVKIPKSGGVCIYSSFVALVYGSLFFYFSLLTC